MNLNEVIEDKNVLIERAHRLLDKITNGKSQWDRFVAAYALHEVSHELRGCVLKEGGTEGE